MKQVIICGAIVAADEIIAAQKELEAMGFAVEIPWGVKRYIGAGYQHMSEEARHENKKRHDLITAYYERIQKSDIVLVVNVEKRGIKNYIGGNTFLEMGFAHVLKKPLYVLNPLPDVSYRSEIDAMNLRVLNGKLSALSSK